VSWQREVDDMTRALIICVSVSNRNTAAIARAVAAPLEAEVRTPEEVDPATLGEYDVVGFGSGIFAMSHHPRLRRYVASLPAGHGTKAFVFTTAGTGQAQWRPWERPLEEVLTEKGYDVVGSFACKGYDTWLPLRLVGGINKGHPDVRDLTHAHQFAEDVAVRLAVGA
jgi:flavodoxin